MLPCIHSRNAAVAAVVVAIVGPLASLPAAAATRTVCASGCDHVTIQAAVDAASPGDLILISEPYHTEADIVVDKNLEIAGAGSPRPVVQAATSPGIAGLRILEVSPNTIVTIRDLVLRFGQDLQGWGGAIRNNGILTLRRVDVTDNESSNNGGGIGSYGPLVIEDSTIARNTATVGGGAVCADGCSSLEIRGSVFEANTVPSGPGTGGGLFTGGETEVTNSEFRNNNGGNEGGAIRHSPTSSLVIVDSDLIDNSSQWGGAIESQGPLTMVGCTVVGNAADYGGGLALVSGSKTIEDTLFESNTAEFDGGAIKGGYPGTVIRRSTFRFNSANVADGGAIHLDGALIEESVLYGNSAGRDGGAIFSFGSSGLTLRSSTVSGNQAANEGGGLYIDGVAALSNVTITDNDADPDGSSGADGGGIAVDPTGAVGVRNSIIAGNRDATPNPLLRAADCLGPITNAGYLHLGGLGTVFLEPACLVTGAAPDLGGDPGLDALADNGGPTVTHALLSGSQNIDAGDPSGCRDELGNPLNLDQRGAERIGNCDRGAFELGGDPALFRDGFESGGVWAWTSTSP